MQRLVAILAGMAWQACRRMWRATADCPSSTCSFRVQCRAVEAGLRLTLMLMLERALCRSQNILLSTEGCAKIADAGA